jgi:DNA-binding MarR family transcriptional regulator
VNRTAIHIPIDIWKLGELHPNERVLLAEVLNFEAQGKECFASNAHFAELLNVSEATARGYISKLVNAGFLIREGDRYHRRLRKSTQTSAQNSADECVNPRKRMRKSTQTNAQNSAYNITYKITEKITDNITDKQSATSRAVILPFQTKEFVEAWNEWKDYKKTDHRFKYKTAQSEQRALIKLQNEHRDENDAIDAIHTAIANGWKGLVFGKSKNGRPNARRAENLESDVNREKFRQFAETGRITTDRRNVL